MTQEGDDRGIVKELAAAVSTQAQVSNRIWLALMTVVVVAVLPRVSQVDGGRKGVPLPLGLGDVDPVWFDALSFALLVILTIAFAAAHASKRAPRRWRSKGLTHWQEMGTQTQRDTQARYILASCSTC